MKHDKRKLFLAAIGCILGSSAAQSAVIPCASGTIFTGCSFTDAVGSGNFYDQIVTAVPLAFSDTYQVTLTTAGTVTITLTRTPAAISFSTLTFDSQPFVLGIVGSSFFRTPGTYDLIVAGTASSTASFSGTIDFVANVPEPASWALMIGGFAIGGAMLRRQRRVQALPA